MDYEPETHADSDRPDEFHHPPVADRPDLDLDSVVVRYDERPDRRTVYPDGLSSVERMSTWLTADDDAFVRLDDAR